jgi:hypothetical protein
MKVKYLSKCKHNYSETYNYYKTFRISSDLYDETSKAFGLTIKRSDGVWLPKKEYFPKSQCNYTQSLDGTLTINIPGWLLDKKLLFGYSIVEY